MFGDWQHEGNTVALFPSERCLSDAVLAVQHTNTDQHNWNSLVDVCCYERV